MIVDLFFPRVSVKVAEAEQALQRWHWQRVSYIMTVKREGDTGAGDRREKRRGKCVRRK